MDMEAKVERSYLNCFTNRMIIWIWKWTQVYLWLYLRDHFFFLVTRVMDKRHNWSKNLPFNSSYKPQIKSFSSYFNIQHKGLLLGFPAVTWMATGELTASLRLPKKGCGGRRPNTNWCFVRLLTWEVVKNQILTVDFIWGVHHLD